MRPHVFRPPPFPPQPDFCKSIQHHLSCLLALDHTLVWITDLILSELWICLLGGLKLFHMHLSFASSALVSLVSCLWHRLRMWMLQFHHFFDLFAIIRATQSFFQKSVAQFDFCFGLAQGSLWSESTVLSQPWQILEFWLCVRKH